jgi:hypothetical protein
LHHSALEPGGRKVEVNEKSLIVIEDDRVCVEALTFVREYCSRMKRGAVILILESTPSPETIPLGTSRKAIHGASQRAGRLADELSAEFTRLGISVSAAIRIGDPGSELLKFLAERPPFALMIWGSDDALPKHHPDGRAHWMVETTKMLECPIYAVSQKGLHGKRRRDDG